MRFPVKIKAGEDELIAAWALVFNDIYQSGRENDAESLDWLLASIEQRRQSGGPSIYRFLDNAAHLAKEAWQQGYQEAQV